MNALGTHLHLYQCISWCYRESLNLALVNFLKTQRVCPSHKIWFMSELCWVFGSFWPKTALPLCPTLPIHSFWLQETFFLLLFPRRKSPQRGMFCQRGRGKTKNGRNTKRHQNWWIQKLFWTVEKVSIVYCMKWRVLWKWLKFKHLWINKQIFVNKFWVIWGPPHNSKHFCILWKSP